MKKRVQISNFFLKYQIWFFRIFVQVLDSMVLNSTGLCIGLFCSSKIENLFHVHEFAFFQSGHAENILKRTMVKCNQLGLSKHWNRRHQSWDVEDSELLCVRKARIPKA